MDEEVSQLKLISVGLFVTLSGCAMEHSNGPTTEEMIASAQRAIYDDSSKTQNSIHRCERHKVNCSTKPTDCPGDAHGMCPVRKP